MDRSPSRTARLFVVCADLLFFLLIGVGLVLFLFAASPRSLWTRAEPITYTLRLSPLREEYASELCVGDTVLDAVGKRQIGSIREITVLPATTDVFDRVARTRRRVPYPGYVTVTLTVSADGVRTEEAMTVNGFPLYRGDGIYLRFPHLSARGVCTAIASD